jgi:hypothetical protein
VPVNRYWSSAVGSAAPAKEVTRRGASALLPSNQAAVRGCGAAVEPVSKA